MRLETVPSVPELNTTRNTDRERPWGRPRRQTDSAVRRRASSEFPLREPARHSVCFSPPPEPQIVSPLSVHGLSNPAFAEISSRKFNLRSSTGSLVPASPPSPQSSSLSVAVANSPDSRDRARAGFSPSSTSGDISASPATSTTITNTTNNAIQPFLFAADSRSFHFRRAPASHSSYGIETANGPPPALSTRRSLLQDKTRRPSVNLDLSPITRSASSSQLASPARKKSRLSVSIDAILNNDPSAAQRREQLPSSPRTAAPTASKNTMSSTYLGSNVQTSDRDQLARSLARRSMEDSSKDSSADENRSKNEDIFLHIAKSSGNRRDSASRRSSRFAISALSSRASRVNEQTPSPDQSQLAQQKTPSYSQDNPPSLPFSHSFGGFSTPASAHPLDEPNRIRYFNGSSARSTIGLPSSRFSRFNQDASPELSTSADKRASLNDARLHRRSTTASSYTVRQASKSDAAERSKPDTDRSTREGTESTLSTNAPSTVWDELDDLKSRIRKLELTGKLPPSSAAAISSASGERPQTATTTVTTLSPSPKQHRRKASAPVLDAEGTAPSSQTHPLLHSALAKAKTVLNGEVYQALETTANDALTLVTMLGSTASPSGSVSVVNGVTASERQAKRKADNMCRSLTELCLALADERLISLPKTRPGSRDATTADPNRTNTTETEQRNPPISYRRGISQEPEDLDRFQASSRVPTRLETRRASMMTVGTGAASHSQDTQSTQTPTPPSRLSRISTSFRSKRQRGEEDADDKTITLGRPLARSLTDAGNATPGSRLPARERLSREYASRRASESQQGQPLSPRQEQLRLQPRTPTVSSAIPLRRSILSPASNYAPSVSGVNVQPGSRRYLASSAMVQSPQDVTAGPVDGGDSVQQTPSRIFAPSNKTATSYTSIQQPRIRTNSLGARRLGLRQRTMNASGDVANPVS
ncbi:hypothetical protein C8Q69DRAFT_150645 [Paecilomyces variotii]|uniref:LPXTG-motif cell wall anchor domain protein n=1 Tax=Byssochlamys spectabilis TaxID=264951 RepID=A0A443I198_BYSSP|nr:hypothetical protein C8Q69DRAFT_150645 [Paecilomyces variotii]KAJ9244423.1 hypothetical protein DTO169E5_1641 [Paecilomyces variotii]KAJ9247900.1 hypothetical protein DTO207G8_7793 [Paecilomyces variotii]KAJ9365348.1 hypothetical protein DTO280E4_1003 [Paecilomyces variotii]KAJ9377304.1 hypothetical protein DTO063F5_8309 [Paecilomyces variotii]RWQ97811.1 hypothetical protein C8Q69DRAFT_150645 [Paecilomyces variotii]